MAKIILWFKYTIGMMLEIIGFLVIVQYIVSANRVSKTISINIFDLLTSSEYASHLASGIVIMACSTVYFFYQQKIMKKIILNKLSKLNI